MYTADIRWKQRFQNFKKALALLEAAVAQYNQKGLSDLEAQGLIHRFEFTHDELAWNVMKNYFEYQGNFQITRSRDASREAFRHGLVADGEAWMEMLKSRNLSSHTHDEATAAALINEIVETYAAQLKASEAKMNQLENRS